MPVSLEIRVYLSTLSCFGKYINESVYTVIYQLISDPVSYHLQGIRPSVTRAASGQPLIGLAGVHLCIDHISARGSHPDNNEQFNFILLSFSFLLPTKWIAKTGTHHQCFYGHFTNTGMYVLSFCSCFRIVFMFSILGDEVSHIPPFWRSSDAHSGFSIAWILEPTLESSTCVVWLNYYELRSWSVSVC